MTITYKYGDTHKPNSDRDSDELYFLVFYREGKWTGMKGSYKPQIRDTWFTEVLRGWDDKWKFWNRSELRDYFIVATTENPEADKEFQRLTELVCHDPELLDDWFGVNWVTTRKLRLAQIRKSVAVPTSSSRLRVALRAVASSNASIQVRRLAAALEVMGTSKHGVQVAEHIASLHLSIDDTFKVAEMVARSRTAEKRVLDALDGLDKAQRSSAVADLTAA